MPSRDTVPLNCLSLLKIRRLKVAAVGLALGYKEGLTFVLPFVQTNTENVSRLVANLPSKSKL